MDVGTLGTVARISLASVGIMYQCAVIWEGVRRWANRHSWSPWDAWDYAVMAINLVVAGLLIKVLVGA